MADIETGTGQRSPVTSTVTFIAGKCMAYRWNPKESRAVVSFFFTAWLTSICEEANIRHSVTNMTKA
ncbi:hypothetical protein QCE47_06730 [Caballeronia sp. LZ025]|uniref:hypothetical protein n=1 Tax=Caballeronia TaxID=1827195 RepID=UPI001FD3A602|nr:MULTISPECIES: hypothetical protein [Caballeronia]MDR5732042.1 hypothetical protein [Caballeronia sp. LZ025]